MFYLFQGEPGYVENEHESKAIYRSGSREQDSERSRISSEPSRNQANNDPTTHELPENSELDTNSKPTDSLNNKTRDSVDNGEVAEPVGAPHNDNKAAKQSKVRPPGQKPVLKLHIQREPQRDPPRDIRPESKREPRREALREPHREAHTQPQREPQREPQKEPPMEPVREPRREPRQTNTQRVHNIVESSLAHKTAHELKEPARSSNNSSGGDQSKAQTVPVLSEDVPALPSEVADIKLHNHKPEEDANFEHLEKAAENLVATLGVEVGHNIIFCNKPGMGICMFLKTYLIT